MSEARELSTVLRASPLAERLALLRRACAAVGQAHARGEVVGQGGDVDGARFRVEPDGEVTIGPPRSAEGPVEGTTDGGERAPEVAAAGASESSDLYALGRLLAAILAEAPEGDAALPPERRQQLEAVVARATREDPAQRYVSAKELLAALEGPAAPPVAAVTPARVSAPRPAGPSLSNLVLLAAVAGCLGFVAARVVKAGRAADRAAAARSEPPAPREAAAPAQAAPGPATRDEAQTSAPAVPPGPCRDRPLACPPQSERDAHGMEFVRVCAGVLCMGADADDLQAQAQERPRHPVALPELWIGKYEVSNREYRQRVKDWPGADELPAAGVSWDEADRFCRALGHRLPTEAEWEYAARGSDGRRYPWGNGGPDAERAVFGDPGGRAGPVQGPPGGEGPFGTRSQAGNVSEWVADCYATREYAEREAAHDVTPAARGPQGCFVRAARGGSFRDPARRLRATARLDASRLVKAPAIGFRCAR